MSFPSFGPGRLPSPVFTPMAPANVSPAEETSIAPPAAPPAAPSFGQPVATPPFVAPPSAGPTMPQAPQHAGAPNFFSAVMPILAAALAGGKDPRAVGEGLAAFQRGRQLKMAEQEHVADRKHREQTEAAEFYSRAIEQSSQLDDPVAFEQWRAAIAPIAELHGINPAVFTFSDQKRQAKAKRDAQSVVDTMRKVHGAVVDDPSWQDAHTTELNGHQVKVSEVYRLAQLPSVRDQKGGLIGPPAPKDPNTPNTPEETFYATFAKEHGVKTFGELSTALQSEARTKWTKLDDKGPDPVLAQIRELTLAQMRANGGMQMSPAQQRAGQAIADDFDRQSKPFVTQVQSYMTIDAAAKKPSAAGDLALIFAYMKMLDPGSTVREGEFANAQNAAGVEDRIRNMWNKMLSGERLNDNQRADFVGQAKSQMDQARTRQRGYMEVYRERARLMNVPEAYAVIDYEKAFGLNTAGGGSAGPKVGERRTINGKLGEWDGKGWALVGGTK